MPGDTDGRRVHRRPLPLGGQGEAGEATDDFADEEPVDGAEQARVLAIRLAPGLTDGRAEVDPTEGPRQGADQEPRDLAPGGATGLADLAHVMARDGERPLLRAHRDSVPVGLDEGALPHAAVLE